MGLDFYTKRRDTAKYLRVTLIGSSQPLDPGATCTFLMRNASGTVVVNAPAVIVDFNQRIVEYRWAPADVQTVGVFDAEFFVSQLGVLQTFPDKGFITVTIEPDIA